MNIISSFVATYHSTKFGKNTHAIMYSKSTRPFPLNAKGWVLAK